MYGWVPTVAQYLTVRACIPGLTCAAGHIARGTVSISIGL